MGSAFVHIDHSQGRRGMDDDMHDMFGVQLAPQNNYNEQNQRKHLAKTAKTLFGVL